MSDIQPDPYLDPIAADYPPEYDPDDAEDQRIAEVYAAGSADHDRTENRRQAVAESMAHLAGRIMRERQFFIGRLRMHGKVTDTSYDLARNVGEFVYELPTGERFEIQVRAWSEVPDGVQ